MTIEQLFERRSAPKDAAIEHYQQVYEWFAESAQMYAGTDLAKTVMDTATMFLLAADAERTDPDPIEPATMVCCPGCVLYRAGVR